MATRIGLFGIVVADMPAALTFYRRLGLDIPASADGEPHVDVELPGGLRLAWDTIETIRSFNPEWTPPHGGGRMSLAFRCDSPQDVDRVYGELVEAGHDGHLKPWDAVWGMRYASVRDPDGNPVDLYCELPG
jgi:catechol 2,3-dioxygenase-like lactoylglutathione lyase family enzyme